MLISILIVVLILVLILSPVLIPALVTAFHLVARLRNSNGFVTVTRSPVGVAILIRGMLRGAQHCRQAPRQVRSVRLTIQSNGREPKSTATPLA